MKVGLGVNHELNILLERLVRRGDDLETDNARGRESYQSLKDTLDKQLAEKEFGIQQLSKELEAARQQHDHTKKENTSARQVQADRIRSLESELFAEQKQKRKLEIRHQTEVCRLERLHQSDLTGLEEQAHRRTQAEGELQELQSKHQDLLQHHEREIGRLIHTISDLKQQFHQAQDAHAKQSDELAISRSQQVLAFQQALGALENEKKELLLRISELEEENQETERQKHDLQQLLHKSQELSDRLKATNQDLLQKSEVTTQENQRLREDLDSLEEQVRQLSALGEACPDSENDDSEIAELEASTHQLQATLEDRLKSVVEVLEAKVAKVQEELEVKKTEIAELTHQYSEQTEQYRHLEVQLEENNKRLQVVGMEKFELRAAKNEVDELKEKLADMASQADIESREVTDLKEALAITQARLKERVLNSRELQPSDALKKDYQQVSAERDGLRVKTTVLVSAMRAKEKGAEDLRAELTKLQSERDKLLTQVKSNAQESQPVTGPASGNLLQGGGAVSGTGDIQNELENIKRKLKDTEDLVRKKSKKERELQNKLTATEDHVHRLAREKKALLADKQKQDSDFNSLDFAITGKRSETPDTTAIKVAVKHKLKSDGEKIDQLETGARSDAVEKDELLRKNADLDHENGDLLQTVHKLKQQQGGSQMAVHFRTSQSGLTTVDVK